MMASAAVAGASTAGAPGKLVGKEFPRRRGCRGGAGRARKSTSATLTEASADISHLAPRRADTAISFSSLLTTVAQEFVPSAASHAPLQSASSSSLAEDRKSCVVLSLSSALEGPSLADPMNNLEVYSDESGDEVSQLWTSNALGNCWNSAQENQPVEYDMPHEQQFIDAPGGGGYLFNLDEYTDDSEEEEDTPTTSNVSGGVKMCKQAMVQEAPSTPTSLAQEPAAEPMPEHTSDSEIEATTIQHVEKKLDVLPAKINKKLISYHSSSESEPEGLAATLMSLKRSGFSSESEPEGEMADFIKGLVAYHSSESEPEAEDIEEELVRPASPAAPGGIAVAELLRWRTAAASAAAAKNNVDCSRLIAAEVVASKATTASSPSSASSWRRPTTATTGKSQAKKSKTSSSKHLAPTLSSESTLPLPVSEGGWASQQRLRKRGNSTADGDATSSGDVPSTAEVSRQIKAILNKLSIEKFEQLSCKLTDMHFTTTDHIQLLIEEIFERATTQHHFIDMYTNLCELLHDFFTENPVSDDPKCAFKRLLLNECQRSFERNLEPPANLASIEDGEERTLLGMRYKMRMLGNIRFVGALLARHMIASKVLVGILDDLLSDPIPEALETVAALLTVTGPVFDTSEWPYVGQLDAAFARLKEFSSSKACCQRVKCLLLDVLELRARGWQDHKAANTMKETPTTLRAVAEKAKLTSSPVARSAGGQSKVFSR